MELKYRACNIYSS